jgi:hypothetical protein
MKAALTMSWIAIGIALGGFDTANATNEGAFRDWTAINPKLKLDATIVGSDGRARTPTQHAYWIARHRKEQPRLPADATSRPRNIMAPVRRFDPLISGYARQYKARAPDIAQA